MANANQNRATAALLQKLATRPATQALKAAVARDDSEQVLRQIELLVNRIFCEPLNTAVAFADSVLDETCQWLGSQRLQAKLGVKTTELAKNAAGEEQVVCIVSRLQRSGGHTVVLADILSTPALSGCNVTVLLTGVGGTTSQDTLNVRFGHLPHVRFERAPRFSRTGKLDWLQRRLRELQPNDVWLVNHHQDSTAVAAVQSDQGYTLHYLHHGDHHLCLGVLLSYGEHYDLHPMGINNCRNALGITRNRYLPLTAPDQKLLRDQNTTNQKLNSLALVTCTVGGANKIAVPYWLSYLDVVPLVLEQTNGRHIHIGKLGWVYRQRMAYSLKRKGIKPERFLYISHVDSVSGALTAHSVDLYLASFPYGGAKTMVEVMSSSVPMAVHVHATKQFMSALDLAPHGSLLWSSPHELVDWISKQDRPSLQKLGLQARNSYEDNHRQALFAAALSKKTSTNMKNYHADGSNKQLTSELSVAYEISTQFTMTNLIRRKIRFYGRFIHSLIC